MFSFTPEQPPRWVAACPRCRRQAGGTGHHQDWNPAVSSRALWCPAPTAVRRLPLPVSPLPGLCRLSHAGPAPTHVPVVSPRSQGLAQPGTVAFPPALAPVPSGWEDHLPLLPVASCQNCHFKVKDPCVLGIKLLIHFLQDLGSDFLPPPDWTQPLSF